MRRKNPDRNERPPGELEALRSIGEGFPVRPFRVANRQLKPGARAGVWGSPDATIELEWEGQRQRFAVEYKSPGTPKQVALALQQVRRYTADDAALAPLIVAPYLRQDVLEQLIDERVSGIDLSGNYAVVVPGRWLVVRTGSKNRYPSSAPIKNVYRGKSSLIARALMLKGRFESASAIMHDVAEFGPVSRPTVSKVLTSLEEELIIERTDGIRVIQPDRLLDNLVANYEAPDERGRQGGRIGLSATIAERLNENATVGGVTYAADSPAQYTVLPSSAPTTRIYTLSIETLLGGIELDTTSRFPDVDLIQTTDRTVLYGRQRRGALYWTSPLQVYLELAAGGKREQQAAMQIRADLLAFKYQ
jgi:hypothetical protein